MVILRPVPLGKGNRHPKRPPTTLFDKSERYTVEEYSKKFGPRAYVPVTPMATTGSWANSIRSTEITIPGFRPAPAPAPAPSPRRYPERIRSSPKWFTSYASPVSNSHSQRRNSLARKYTHFPPYLVRQRSLANTHGQTLESPSTRPSYSVGTLPFYFTRHTNPRQFGALLTPP